MAELSKESLKKTATEIYETLEVQYYMEKLPPRIRQTAEKMLNLNARHSNSPHFGTNPASGFGGKARRSAADAEDFGKLADNWWAKDGPMAPLHKINPLRALFLDTQLNLAGKTLLDIGCGGGIFAEAMAERGAKVTAIDPSQQLINIAKEHAAERNLAINYICADAAELLRRNESFEIVTCLEVLEHLSSPAELVAQASALTQAGGYGYFSTINRTLPSFVLAIVAAEYVLRWLPRGTHSHKMFIQPAELCDWLEMTDMQPQVMKGIVYQPLKAMFELSDQVHTNYLLLARKAKPAKPA